MTCQITMIKYVWCTWSKKKVVHENTIKNILYNDKEKLLHVVVHDLKQ